MTRIGGDDAGFFVETDALRADATHWEEMSQYLTEASTGVEDLLEFNQMTDMNLLVQQANAVIQKIRECGADGAVGFTDAATTLRNLANKYEETDAEVF